MRTNRLRHLRRGALRVGLVDPASSGRPRRTTGPAWRDRAPTSAALARPCPVERTRPVVHVCTPPASLHGRRLRRWGRRGLAPEDVFVALLEYGSDLAGTGLFERRGCRAWPSPVRREPDAARHRRPQREPALLQPGGGPSACSPSWAATADGWRPCPRRGGRAHPERRDGGDDARQGGESWTRRTSSGPAHPASARAPRRGARAPQRAWSGSSTGSSGVAR